MTGDELAEAIAALRAIGRDMSGIEAKRAGQALPKSTRETLSSFANTPGGGVIIFGIDEASGFPVTGVENPAQLTSDLADLCASGMEPALRPLIEIHACEGKTVVTAEVPELDLAAKPCFYRGQGLNNGSYIRLGDSDRRLSSYEVQMLIASRGQPRDDERTVEGGSATDLNPDAIQGYLARLRQTRTSALAGMSDEQLLIATKVLSRDAKGEHRPTIAGWLTFADYPQSAFPQLNVTFVHYPTHDGQDMETGRRFLDNRAIDGPIPLIVRDTLTVLKRNMSRRAVVQGVGRRDEWEYPEMALREALVNALVHRDLSPASLGTQVQVEMYPDRLVVRNPGGLFGPVTVQQLTEGGTSSSRNAALLRILEDVVVPDEDRAVCENRGSGILTMMKSLRSANMSLPKLNDRISSFTVEFPNHALFSEDDLQWLRSLGHDDLTESQSTALLLMRGGQAMNNSTYRASTGVDSRVATSELQDLVARELVLQAGGRRWATYTLPGRLTVGNTGRRRLPPADRRATILSAIGEAVLSRAEIAERTGLPNAVVGRWLRLLRGEGKVRLTTGKPQSKLARYERVAQLSVDDLQLSLTLEED